MSSIRVSSHPLVAHKISILRNKNTKPKQVRELMREIGQLLGYEATADLPTKSTSTLESPLAPYAGTELATTVGLVPILRAGLIFVDVLQDMIPTARVLHLGIFRERISLQPVEYYNKLPAEPNVEQILVLEPMIATGGTAVAAASILKEWGIKSKIKLITICASRQGLDYLMKHHPDVEVFVGDAGDRLYDTPHLN
ncbi:19921_t:CDS:2 [Dentiscutata erythropus]|uniref:uracil phosphoribosyltransferase n=1 Tax=Dentiscutata erythropus TaxID=1348616 RepID=A0A9N9P3Q7_9GLOM|nr:19921_t:CDS:2 [Dentiscutata erythropus]